MKLSELFAKFHCLDNTPQVMDLWSAVFAYTAWSATPPPEMLVDCLEAATSISKQFMFTRPLAPRGPVEIGGELFENDLGIPWAYTDEDGVARVVFPGSGYYLTSAATARDFRFLLLGRLALENIGYDYLKNPVILEVYYPDKVVRAYTEGNSTWNIFSTVLATLKNTSRQRTPGNHCLGCVNRDTCEPFAGYALRPGMEVEESGNKQDMAQKLYLTLQMAYAEEQVATEKRRTIMKRLVALAADGKVQIGELFKMEVRDAHVDKFPYRQVYELLAPLGYWDDEMARINVTALKKAIPKFPPKVQEYLERLKFTETTDFNVRDIVGGNAHAIQAPSLRGISGRA